MNFVLEQCILIHDFSVRMLYYETLYYASLYYEALYYETLYYATLYCARDARDSTTCYVSTTWPRRVNRELKQATFLSTRTAAGSELRRTDGE